MSTHEPPTGPDPQDPDAPVPPPPPTYGSTSYPPPPGGGSGGWGSGGYGSGGFPPPPPPAGPGPAQPFSATDAIAYGWSKFVANPGQWLIAGLAMFAVTVLASGLSWFVAPAADPFSGSDPISGVGVVGTLGNLVSTFLSLVISGFVYRGALDEAEGRRFDLADAIARVPVGPVVLTSLLLSVGITVGLALCVVPGVIFAFLTWFALLFVVDQHQSPLDAISSSVKLVSANVGQTLLLALLSGVLFVLAICACGLGLFVVFPVVSVATAYAYRRFQGQPVA
ncbi:hypothetical protein AFL01nite_01470 [Aeromicrobium flavum]|uniref:Integral membrane protein n=1 Tax=Aeromicrobium flavum TaxID=416568 RepID=A0A512HR30_9ACTN|nr:hypothetical protein [Aeromicrobium flavum]GEO87820.1 hypothetical protein AFL01nite_01470 [Aeromicrobium flavum]